MAARVPVVVVVDNGVTVGFAAAVPQNVPFSTHRCVEAVVYVTPAHRRRGAGRAALSELIVAARSSALWKLMAYALPENAAGAALLAHSDFRNVGTLAKHVQLEGGWRDIVVYERLVLAARRQLTFDEP